MSHTQETEKISWLADLYQRTNKNWFGLNHSSEASSTSNNVSESKKDNVADDTLIRKVAEMILDEFHLIGDSDNVKNTNTKLVNFTQPADLEVNTITNCFCFCIKVLVDFVHFAYEFDCDPC